MGTKLVTELFAIVGEILTGLLGLLVSATGGVTEIFYKEGAEGGFTIYGVFLLFGLGMTFMFFAWKVIQSLIRK